MTIVERFESLAVGAALSGSTGLGTWSSTGATASGTVVTGKYGCIAFTGVHVMKFTLAKTKAVLRGDHVQFKAYRAHVNKKISFAAEYVSGTDGAEVLFENDGNIYAWDEDSSTYKLLIAYTVSTWYWVRIIAIDTTHFDVKLSTDGTTWTTYNNSGGHFHAYGTLSKFTLFSFTSNGDTTTVTVDDMRICQGDVDAIVEYVDSAWASSSCVKPVLFTTAKLPGNYHDCVKIWKMYEDEVDKCPGYIRMHAAFWIFVSSRTEGAGEYVRSILKSYSFNAPFPDIKVDRIGLFNNFYESQLTFDIYYNEART